MLPNKVPKNNIPDAATSKRLSRLTVVDFNDIYDYSGAAGFTTRYPKYNPYLNNEFKYAEKQSAWDKLGNMFKRFGYIGINTFYNQVGQTFNNISGKATWKTATGAEAAGNIMAANNKFPIYKSKEAAQYEEQNKGLRATLNKYNPLVSPDFIGYWAEAGSQIGFTAGTVGYMLAENLLLKKVGIKGASVTKQLKNFYKTLYYVKNFEKARKTAYIAGKSAQLVGQFGLYTTRMVNLATGEGSIEANIASNEFYYDQYMKLSEQGMATPEKLAEIRDAAQKVGNATFGMNIGILTISNFITMGNIFKPSFLAKDAFKEAVKGLTKNKGKYYTKKELANTFLDKVGFYGVKAIKGTAKTVNEGFEEVAQGIASRAAQNYYDVLESDIGKSNFSFIEQLGRDAVESFESGEGWDEFVSGMITGMGIGGFTYGVDAVRGKNKKAYQQQLEARDALNESIQQYTAAFGESRNYKNLNEQTAISLKTASQVAEGNQKAIKDLRTEARNSLFETMYKTGVGDEHIDFMFEGLEAMQKENPSAVEETIGDGKTLEMEKADLKSQYKQWTKTADKNMTAFNSENYSNKEAYARAIFDLTSMENHLQDTIARVENIKSTLRENAANTPMAGKLNDVMEALADPQKFDRLIASQQEYVDAQQESLNNLQLSKEERAAQQKELEQEKEYLSILKDSKERIVDEDGNIKEGFNSDTTITRLIQNFNKLDQATFNSRVQPELRDLMTLSVERSNLLKTINILSDERYFKKYAEAYQMVQELHRNSILNRFKNQDKPTEQNKVDEAASNTQVNSQETEEAKKLAEQIDIEEGRYTYKGKPYDSFDKAFEAMQKDASEAVRKQPEVIKALKEETKKRLTSASPTQSEQGTVNENESVVPQKIEEQWKKDQDISKVPDEVLENIFQKPVNTRTELERQLLDADEARGESSYASRSSAARSKQSKDVDNVPKTKSDVKNERPFAESSTSTLVHFFRHAVAVINTIKGYLSKDNVVNLDKDMVKLLSFLYNKNKKPKYSVTTIHLNDTIITDNIRDVKDATQDQIRQDLEENDVAIIKDSRGRLVLITEGRSFEGTKQKIADLYGLYINADARGKISSIRIRSYDGELVESSFEQGVFTDDSVRQVNKLGKGDRVQVVIPNNEYNRKLVADFEAALAKLVEKPNYSIDKAKELYEKMVLNELVIDFISQGNVVGRMRSGNYFTVDNKATGKIVNFRSDMVSYEDFMEFVKRGGDRNRVIGTVEVNTTYTERNVGLDEQGNFVFSTLEEYEKSLEDNPDLDVKIEYFVATSRHVMEDKNGNKVGTSQINRNKPFRTGAVYMRATDSNGNFVVMQAVRDDSKTYTTEDLKKNDFKKELEVNLKTGENPVITKRLYINRSSFDSKAPQQPYIEKITTELKKADGNSAYITHNDKKVKYSNVAIDEEVQVVYATQENGLVIEIPFRDVREVNGVAPSTTATETTETSESNTTTEISYKDVSPTLKEQWILENGEVNKTYSLPDGTRIKVISRTDNTVTLERGSQTIEVQVGENQDVVDFVQTRDQVASEKISDAELYEILKAQENGLSLRQKIVKIFHAGRLAGLSGKIESSNKLIGRTLSDFVSQSTIDMLNILLPSRTGGLIIKLAEAYREGVLNKNAPKSMEELLERAEVSQEDRQVLRDMMTYEEFASFFAYISQADTIYSFQTMNVVRYGMQSEVETLKRQLDFIEAMDFEATPEERLNNRLEQVVNEIIKIFGRQSLFIEGIGMTPDGFITMEDKPTNVEVLTILIDMFEKSYGNTSPKDIAKNFIEANDKLAEYGIKIHLDSMFTHEINYQRKGIGRDVILNNPKEASKAFLEEFDDLVMSEKAVEAINKDKPFLVKDEKGLTVEFFAKDLPDTASEKVVSTTNLINEELRRYGMEISREYVAAYLNVNEDIFALHDRIVNRIVDIEEVLNYNTGDIRTNMSPVTTEYFDKTKAARQAEENTCS